MFHGWLLLLAPRSGWMRRYCQRRRGQCVAAVSVLQRCNTVLIRRYSCANNGLPVEGIPHVVGGKLLNERFPAFARKSPLLRRPVVWVLRALLREKPVNDFIVFADGRYGLAFNDGIVEYFRLRYRVHNTEQIPASGRC